MNIQEQGLASVQNPKNSQRFLSKNIFSEQVFDSDIFLKESFLSLNFRQQEQDQTVFFDTHQNSSNFNRLQNSNIKKQKSSSSSRSDEKLYKTFDQESSLSAISQSIIGKSSLAFYNSGALNSQQDFYTHTQTQTYTQTFSSNNMEPYQTQSNKKIVQETEKKHKNQSVMLLKTKQSSSVKVKQFPHSTQNQSEILSETQDYSEQDSILHIQKTDTEQIKDCKEILIRLKQKLKFEQANKKKNQQQNEQFPQEQKVNGTTIMICNIPNKYSKKVILQEINQHFVNQFDFFYLPIDFINKCNMGYAFINFVSAQYVPDFFLKFNNKKWNRFNSQKICQLKFAKIQGKESLIKHFKDSQLQYSDNCKIKPFIKFN